MAKNYYEILEISTFATQEEIKNAYRTKAKQFHPDINKNSEANELMAQINEAYETLSDLNLRKEYDIRQIAKNKFDDFSYKSTEQKSAYSSYTKSKEESEFDFDEWIKEYLKSERESHNYVGEKSFSQFDIDSLKKLKGEILTGKTCFCNNDNFSEYIIQDKIKTLHR